MDEPLSKRFDKSRRLFEHRKDDDGDSWKESEIAKKREEQKERDMQVKATSFSFWSYSRSNPISIWCWFSVET